MFPAAADELVATVDDNMFELPVMLPSDVVVVVAGEATVVTPEEDDITFEVLPAMFVVVVFAPIGSTASLDGDGNICSNSICSTRQYSL